MKFNLLEQLEQLKPFNEEEKSNVAKTIKFVTENSNCFERENETGHITGSSFLLNKNLTKVLLTHHKKLNMWLQLGGHSDGDDNTINVALKEAVEESGIKNISLLKNEIADVDVQTVPFNVKTNEPEHLHFDIIFFLVADNEDYIVSDESNALQWFTIKEFEDLLLTDKSLTRMLAKWKQLLTE